MTGEPVYTVPEPYNREVKDTCDYRPPSVSISPSGNNLIASVKKGSYDIAGYKLVVDGLEIPGVSVNKNGVVSGFTLDGSEQSIKFTVSDTAGYQTTAELTVDKKKSGN